MRTGLCVLLLVAACAYPRPFGLVVRVVDEQGEVIPEATLRVENATWEADRRGRIRLRGLEHPVLAAVEAPGFLAEPVPLGRESDGEEVEVVLLSAAGGRFAVHAAGDVMIGRRYLAPDEGHPLVDTGDEGRSARALVSDAAEAFGLADFTLLNLETVVGRFAAEEAYPEKRWLLLTPPSALSGLEALGTTMVGLANNHQRDWMDAGVSSTLQALDARDLLHLGAGLDASEAGAGMVGEIGGTTIGMLAWTSVDGDFVNDQYPPDDEAEPADVAAEDAWKWAFRTWGEPDLGIAVQDRRAGGAWRAIQEVEALLSEEEAAALWASATAVYPELQDWVARRGHGGAAAWDPERSPAEIAALRPKVDLLLVQLHMGFQFSAAPSEGVRLAATAAVEAGADLVICHHPHILQGFEWYQGSLIAWSLGNYVFDQDFHSTFPSGFLRTVWEGDGSLLEARFLPGFLDAYRPVPAVDGLARHIARTVWDRAHLPGTASRGADLVVRVVGDERGASIPGFRLEHSTFRLLEESRPARAQAVRIPSAGAVRLPRDGLVRATLSDPPPAGVAVGRDLFGLGGFEDEDTDADAGEGAGWTWSSPDISLWPRRPASGAWSLQLARGPDATDRVSARTTARIPLEAHRLYADEDGQVPLDGDATYSIWLRAWVHGENDRAVLRVALYHFDDLDPTEDPESVLLREVELPLPLDGEGDWEDLLVDIPSSAFTPVDGRVPNAMMLYVSLNPPDTTTTILRVDDLALVEWRPADEQPSGWQALDFARSTDGRAHEVQVDLLPW